MNHTIMRDRKEIYSHYKQHKGSNKEITESIAEVLRIRQIVQQLDFQMLWNGHELS